jgi:hypothetical protein
VAEHAGLVALNAVYVAVGFAVLYGIGIARDRGAARFVGVALVTGWALLGVAGSLLVMAGLAATVPELLAAAVVLAVAGVALGRWFAVDAPPRGPGARGLEALVAVGGATLLVVFVGALFRRALLASPVAWDAWAFWIPRAESLVYFDGIDLAPGGYASFANPDYPPLVPVVYATTFRFAGTVDPTLLPLQQTILVTAFLGALAALLAPYVRPVLLWPSLALLAVLPNFGGLVASTLADESLSVSAGLAAVCGGLWLLYRAPALAALCGVFLAAAALTKNEGLVFGVVLGVMLALGSRGHLRTAGALALAPVLAVLPWKLWLATHDVGWHGAYRLSDLARPSYLADRIDRLGTALVELPSYLVAPSRWLFVVPLTLLLAALLVRRRPGLAVYVLGTLSLAFLGNAAIYWISTFEIHWYISTSAERTVSSMVVFSAAVFPLLLEQALGDRAP